MRARTGRIAVLGAGNWGTVLAQLIAENGFDVTLWTRTERQRDAINRERVNREARLENLIIHERVVASSDLASCVEGAPVMVVAIPAQSFRTVCEQLGPMVGPDQLLIHATKGLEVGTHRRMTEIVAEETCLKMVGVLAGPNIATEIASGMPAGTVVTSPFPHVVAWGKRLVASERMMVFAGDDVLGVELCGALKNVVAIAAGIAFEMNVGENAKALLVTRGLAEITALAAGLGARPATLTGLAGAGDLMVTCASQHSRNFRVGRALARGLSLQTIQDELGMVAEGVATSRAAHQLAKEVKVPCPLLDRVHRVLHEGLSPQEALGELMRMRTGRDVAWG